MGGLGATQRIGRKAWKRWGRGLERARLVKAARQGGSAGIYMVLHASNSIMASHRRCNLFGRLFSKFAALSWGSGSCVLQVRLGRGEVGDGY
jgi:hypothetical protein